MNQNILRIVLTTVVWLLMLGAIALAAFIDSSVSAGINIGDIQIALMIMATIATIGIWASADGLKSEDGKSQKHYIGNEDEKAKRVDGAGDSHANMLLELLDEAELADFKERLKRRVLNETYLTDDGELAYRGTPLEDLIEDQQAARHR